MADEKHRWPVAAILPNRIGVSHPMEKYTDVKPVVMEGYPDAHHVFLISTNQRFCVSLYGCETKEEAEWMRDMLCVALGKILETERPK